MKKFFIILIAFIISCNVFSKNSFNEMAFSSFEHRKINSFSITDNQQIISIQDLYSFIQQLTFNKYQQTENSEFRNLLKNIVLGRIKNKFEIIIFYNEKYFSISDKNNFFIVSDVKLIHKFGLFVKMLNYLFNFDVEFQKIKSAEISISGSKINYLKFENTNGANKKLLYPELCFPLINFSSYKNFTTDSKSKNLLGYFVGSTNGASYSTVNNFGNKINFISPAWFWLDFEKPGIFKKDLNFGNFTDSQAEEIVKNAHYKGIKVLGLFHNLTNNSTSSKELLHRILSEPRLREKCINDIVHKVTEYNFDGVNMDFEFIYLKDKDGYSEFMRLLKNKLEPLGKLTTVAVPAKFSDSVNTWNGQFDFEKLGSYSDLVMVMTYNEHGKWSKPGPVASFPWVEKAMKYAVSKIPSEKIMMGFPTYGYNWTDDTCKSVSCKKAEILLKEHNAELKWNSYYASPYFEYKDSSNKTHTVWFENKKSIDKKFYLIDKYNLNGACMWRLGMESEDFWSIIK